MNKAMCIILGVVMMFCNSVNASEYTETLKPEAWNTIDVVVVQADMPELLGVANSASLPMREQPAQTVSTMALTMLGDGSVLGQATFWSLILMLALFIAFVRLNGPVRLHQGFSGIKIKRWTGVDVMVHWVGAIACIALIGTGVVIAGGRYLFADLMSAYGWQSFIEGAVSSHHFFTLPFIIGWLVMTVKWAKKQLPEACDIAWFKSLGGYLNFGPLKGRHPDSGFANAGEKLWFWCFAILGGVLVISGGVIMFPEILALEKGAMMWMLVLHCLSAIIVGCFSIVHIFMATLISEGGMECMVSGYCDENWAKQHHNLWLKQVQQ